MLDERDPLSPPTGRDQRCHVAALAIGFAGRPDALFRAPSVPLSAMSPERLSP
jgi:hypothetical protein